MTNTINTYDGITQEYVALWTLPCISERPRAFRALFSFVTDHLFSLILTNVSSKGVNHSSKKILRVWGHRLKSREYYYLYLWLCSFHDKQMLHICVLVIHIYVHHCEVTIIQNYENWPNALWLFMMDISLHHLARWIDNPFAVVRFLPHLLQVGMFGNLRPSGSLS